MTSVTERDKEMARAVDLRRNSGPHPTFREDLAERFAQSRAEGYAAAVADVVAWLRELGCPLTGHNVADVARRIERRFPPPAAEAGQTSETAHGSGLVKTSSPAEATSEEPGTSPAATEAEGFCSKCVGRRGKSVRTHGDVRVFKACPACSGTGRKTRAGSP